MAGGIVLQVDQATFAHQTISGYERECREDANMELRVHLCADRHHQKGTSPRCLALRFITDIVGISFRENPYFMRLADRRRSNNRSTQRRPTDFVRLLTGH